MKDQQDSIIDKLFGTFLQDVENDDKDAHRVTSLVDQDIEGNIEWAALGQHLFQEGITDVDIDANESSIKELLRHRLPSYRITE